MTDVSVIVTSRNTRHFLRSCLDSVLSDLRASPLTWEVWVVDDGSSDGSAEMVQATYRDVRLMGWDAPRGYAAANNAAIGESRGRYVWLLNSDTVVPRGAAVELTDGLRAHPWAGAAGPVLLNPDGSIQRSCFRFPWQTLLGNSLPLARMGLWDDYRRWDHRQPRRVDFISSAALLVRREVFDQVGVLDERFRVYGVDVDLALRMRRHGWGMVSLPRPRVIHYGGGSWTGRAIARMSDHMRGQELVIRKHYGDLGFLAFRLIVALNSALRLPVWRIAGVLGSPNAAERVTFFRQLLAWSLTPEKTSSGVSREA